MKISGIIAEYNPFHNGHQYHIQKTREAGATHIVVVLGSQFTQRGDVALLSKTARAEAAVLGGADLVLELPCSWSMSTANNFAVGGISILSSLGVVDELSFGSEKGNISDIINAAKASQSAVIKPELDWYLSQGETFAAARQKAVEAHFGTQIADILREPNNTLATEYILAAQNRKSNLSFFTVNRLGAAHHSEELHTLSSASAIRKAFLQKELPYASMPSFSAKILRREEHFGRTANIQSLESSILCKLKLMQKDDFKELPDIREGLENRIYHALREANTLEGLYQLVKTKRYTLARVRRLILSAFLGIDNTLWLKEVPYIRVLALGKGGAEILKKAKNTAAVPVIMKAKQALALGGLAEKAMKQEIAATEMFYMATAGKSCGKTEYNSRIFQSVEQSFDK